jgi:hypothetical protein
VGAEGIELDGLNGTGVLVDLIDLSITAIVSVLSVRMSWVCSGYGPCTCSELLRIPQHQCAAV